MMMMMIMMIMMTMMMMDDDDKNHTHTKLTVSNMILGGFIGYSGGRVILP